MNDTVRTLLIFAAGILITWFMGWVRTFLAKRVRVSSPEARALARINPLVEAMMDNQEIIFDAVEDVARNKGDDALKKIDGCRRRFAAGLRARALLKPEVEEKLEELNGA
jgi:hypothetical protein